MLLYLVRETRPRANRYDGSGKLVPGGRTSVVDDDNDPDEIDSRPTVSMVSSARRSSQQQQPQISSSEPPAPEDNYSLDDGNEGRRSDDPMLNIFWADRLLPDSSAIELPFFPTR